MPYSELPVDLRKEIDQEFAKGVARKAEEDRKTKARTIPPP